MEDLSSTAVPSRAKKRNRASLQCPPKPATSGTPRGRTSPGLTTTADLSVPSRHALARVNQLILSLYRHTVPRPMLLIGPEVVRDFVKWPIVRSQFEASLTAAGCLVRHIDVCLGRSNTRSADHYKGIADLRDMLFRQWRSAGPRCLTLRGSDVRAAAIVMQLFCRPPGDPRGHLCDRVNLLIKTEGWDSFPPGPHNNTRDYALLRKAAKGCSLAAENGIYVQSNDENVYCSVMDGIADSAKNRTVDLPDWNPGILDSIFSSNDDGVISDLPLRSSWLSQGFWTKIGENVIRYKTVTVDGSADEDSFDLICAALAVNTSVTSVKIARIGLGCAEQRSRSWLNTSSVIGVLANRSSDSESNKATVERIAMHCKSINTEVVESIINLIRRETAVTSICVEKTNDPWRQDTTLFVDGDGSTRDRVVYPGIPTGLSGEIVKAMWRNYTTLKLNIPMLSDKHRLLVDTFCLLNACGRREVKKLEVSSGSGSLYLILQCRVLGRLLESQNESNPRRSNAYALDPFDRSRPRHFDRGQTVSIIARLTGAYLHIRDSPGLFDRGTTPKPPTA